jgi:two-component system invasion response regulator UvrY
MRRQTEYSKKVGARDEHGSSRNWPETHERAHFNPHMRILIADDHVVVRRGLKQILAEEFPDAEFGEAGNAAETLALVGSSKWDVVVLDITMPDRSGLEALSEIHKTRPDLPVLVLSMHPEDHFAIRVLREGARGYLSKDIAPEELVNAIRKVVSGGRYVSPLLAEKLAFDLSSQAEKPPQEFLSEREYQVLRLLASGKIVSEIARELGLSVKTVSTYRARILDKMHLSNNAQLMRYAMLNHLV